MAFNIKKYFDIENLVPLIFSALAVLSILSFLENDDSKIVSRKGRKILQDKKRMNEIKQRLQQKESNQDENYTEVYI